MSLGSAIGAMRTAGSSGGRPVRVILAAEVAGFRSSMAQAKKSVDDLSGSVHRNKTDINTLTGSLSKMALVGVAGMVAVGKAAIDWESAWAGVTKTVDGSAQQLSALEGSLRDMAKSMPATHSEIAAVAEAAGQLGVATDDVAAFTRTMIDLGETTNLSSDEAATSLAQLMNVMGTSADDVGRLGAAVVDLGNKGASTERDIVQMGQRIAAAGKAFGMAETDVLAFASAVASTGTEVEAGGTAISMTFRDIDRAVREGGESLDLIAQTAGMSSQQFTQAWGTDAAGAVASFIEGLGGMAKAGGNANGVLDSLKMAGDRQISTLMNLAQAGDLLRENLDNSKQAWTENTALVEEAAKRYATTESQIAIAWNNIRDAGIDAGAVLLPMIADVTDGVSGMARIFGELPSGMQEALVTFGGLGTASLLAVVGFTKAMQVAGDLRVAVMNLRTAYQNLSAAQRTAALTAGGIGVALTAAALIVGSYALEQEKARSRVEELTGAIRDQGSVINDVTVDMMTKQLADQGALEAAEKLGIALGDVTLAALGEQDAMDRVNGRLNELTSAHDDYVRSLSETGAADGAVIAMDEQTRAAQELRSVLGDSNSEVGKAAEQARLQEEASAGAADATGDYADAQADAATSAQEAADAISDQNEELQKQIDLLFDLGKSNLSLHEAELATYDAFARANEVIAENGRVVDLNTQAGRENRDAVYGMAGSWQDYIQQLIESGAPMETIRSEMGRAQDQLSGVAERAGFTADEYQFLLDKFGLTPEQIETVATLHAQQAMNEADDLNKRLNDAARDRTATIRIQTIGHVPAVRIGDRTMTYQADGGVYGRRENHVAQIAPAGAWRVWAEPETGGEAYIPLAPSKRPRSRAIAEETVRRLNGEVSWNANGGLYDRWNTTAAPTAAARSVEVQQNVQVQSHVDAEFLVRRMGREMRRAANGV